MTLLGGTSSGTPEAERVTQEEPPAKKQRKKGKAEDTEAWKFLIGESPVDDVVVHKTWPDFSSHEEDLFKAFLLRSRIGVCLDSLAAVVGHYTAEDLMVASRRSSKGVWITEVWTLRDFKPKELRIAPVTTQMKETHLTSGCSSQVGLPSHGAGKHPNGSSIALDGRGRSSMHPAGACGEVAEKRGSLFWCIQRTHEKGKANAVEEPCTFGSSVEHP